MEKLREFIAKNQTIILCFWVFLFCFGIRVWAINQKIDLHEDEGYTTLISTNSEYWQFPVEEGLYRGSEIKNLLYSIPKSLPETIEDIRELHKYNNDAPHSNLYYSLYRLWSNGLGDFDLKKHIKNGCNLNLLIFIFSYIMMYKMLCEIYGKRSLLVPFGLFVTLCSIPSITNTLFIRTYALQECFFILTTYLAIKTYKNIKNPEYGFGLKDMLELSLTASLTLLSGYYASILLGIYLIILLGKSLHARNYSGFRMLICATVLSSLLSFLIYPGIIFTLTNYRAIETSETVSSLSNFVKVLIGTPVIFLKYIFCIPAIIATGICLRQQTAKEYSNLPLQLSVIALVWIVAILYIAPYKTLRYIMSVCPIFLLIFPYFAERVRNPKAYIITIFSIYLINLGIGVWGTINPASAKIIPFAPKFQFIQNLNYKKLIFRENPKLPTYIISDGIAMPQSLFPVLIDEQTYKITYSAPPISEDHFYTIRVIYDTPFKPAVPSEKEFDLINQNLCANGFVCEEYRRK